MTRDEAIALAEKHECLGHYIEENNRIIAAILEAANGRWRDMESAPKDGDAVMMFARFIGLCVAQYHSVGE